MLSTSLVVEEAVYKFSLGFVHSKIIGQDDPYIVFNQFVILTNLSDSSTNVLVEITKLNW